MSNQESIARRVRALGDLPRKLFDHHLRHRAAARLHEIDAARVAGEVDLHGLQGRIIIRPAHHINQFSIDIVNLDVVGRYVSIRHLDVEDTVRGVRPDLQTSRLPVGNACRETVPREKLVENFLIPDVIVIGVIPIVGAAHHFQMLQLGAAVVGVADETQAVVFEIGQGVNGWFARTIVGSLPIVEDFIHSEAEIHAENRGVAVVPHHVVAGAVDVEQPDGRDRRLGGIRIGDESAEGGARGDAVAVHDGHAVGHEAAHRKAREEDAVGVELILDRQRVEEGHQEAGVIDGAGHQSGVPHRADALVEGLRCHDRPSELLGNLPEVERLVVVRDVVAQPVQEEQHGKRAVVIGRGADEVFAFGALPGEVLDLGGEAAYPTYCQ